MTHPGMSEVDSDVYARRREAALGSVVWWERAPGAAYSFRPLEIERLGQLPAPAEGPFANAPESLDDGAFAYGMDAEGRVRVELEGTSFPEKNYEVFVLEDEGETHIYRYNYSSLKTLMTETTLTHDGGVRPVKAVITSPSGEATETYRYEDGRVVQIEFDNPGQGDQRVQGTFLVDYDPVGVRQIRQQYTTGYERVVFTRPNKVARANDLKAVEGALLRAIPGVVARVGNQLDTDANPIVAVALAYSADGSTLPPLLGVLTQSERDAIRDDTDEPWDWWNPAEYDHFDVESLELHLQSSVESACNRLNQSAPLAEIREMLVRVSSRLNQLVGAVRSAPYVVYATDLEGGHVWENLSTGLQAEAWHELESSGLVPTT